MRRKMVDVGTAEDEAYTQEALKYVMELSDIVQLPPLQLAEVCAKASPKVIAYSIVGQPKEVIDKFLSSAPPAIAAQIRDLTEIKVGPRESEGARLKLIETARGLERLGLVRTKKIPLKI
jgi:flagellar motor switch protein FliG